MSDSSMNEMQGKPEKSPLTKEIYHIEIYSADNKSKTEVLKNIIIKKYRSKDR